MSEDTSAGIGISEDVSTGMGIRIINIAERSSEISFSLPYEFVSTSGTGNYAYALREI
jgi:hypothetical protein